jgi:hypothetical protein
MVFDVSGTAVMAIPRFPCPAKAAWYGLAIHCIVPSHILTYLLPAGDGARRTEQAANKTPTTGQERENSTSRRSAYANIVPFPKPPRGRISFRVLSPHMSRYRYSCVPLFSFQATAV